MAAAVNQSLATMPIGDMFSKLAKAMEPLVKAFAQLSDSLGSVARAGIQGTQEAGRLGVAWMLLSRQIASVFIPVIDSLTVAMRSLASYFAALTGDGQRIALEFAGVAIIMPVLARAFSMLRGVISPIYVALSALVAGLYEFFTKTTEGKAILNAIGGVMGFASKVMQGFKMGFEMVVDAIVVGLQAIVRGALYAAVKLTEIAQVIANAIPNAQAKVFGQVMGMVGGVWQKRLDEMMAKGWGAEKGAGSGDARKDVSPNNFRFEALGGAMERITLAAAKMGMDDPVKIAKDQLQVQNNIVKGIGDVADAVRRQMPAIAR